MQESKTTWKHSRNSPVLKRQKPLASCENGLNGDQFLESTHRKFALWVKNSDIGSPSAGQLPGPMEIMTLSSGTALGRFTILSPGPRLSFMPANRPGIHMPGLSPPYAKY